MKNTKLKDLKYEIHGTETNRPALELLKGLLIAFLLSIGVFLAIAWVLANSNAIDNL